jgi:hypothetical protein
MILLIEIAPGLWIQPRKVTAVKKAGKDQCSIFVSGQSAVDGGFLVDKDVEDVVDEINDELQNAEE